ncbi:hypothetical protein CERZMDRAFT_101146 [Cercospora zeae-maydis SCOH1-5]|uniref:Uncharacterized protein n=1 Tax=Cercospora zeae-maydis SCOH1-5 TaxID=717836 RepID=A0A6A6F5W1_9PEZI|nr:hypothetical protein CERZMDRAFT_101146 [Cercospora zeae-maydis SCOH1-5]
MDLDPPDGKAFHIILLRILITVATIFIATYFLATISANTGDVIQELLCSRHSHHYHLSLDNDHDNDNDHYKHEDPSPHDRRLPFYAAITLSTVHIFLFVSYYFFLAGVDGDGEEEEELGGLAIAKYAERICIVLLAIEGVAVFFVGLIGVVVKGVRWYLVTRHGYAAWWEDDGTLD